VTTVLQRWARERLLRHLARLRHGRLDFVEDGVCQSAGPSDAPLVGRVDVHTPEFWTTVLPGGNVGAGEAYMRHEWSSPDPVTVDRVLAYFAAPETPLAEASRAKFDRLCRKLALDETTRVLEIGTGWGGFAVHAAATYGCPVTTTTISERQRRYAERRVAEAGLSDRVTVLGLDYRHLEGTYDRVVSIEMIEAVGHDYLGTFFRACSDRLADDGLLALQAITIRDDHYRRHLRTVDFIKRYIFPGSSIPCLAALTTAASTTDLRLVCLEDITAHYGPTLLAWRRNLLDHRAELADLGYDEVFVRMFDYYLCSCAGSFIERYNGDVQALFAKPRATLPPPYR